MNDVLTFVVMEKSKINQVADQNETTDQDTSASLPEIKPTTSSNLGFELE